MFLKTYNFFPIKCHSKNNGPVLLFNTALYLGIETVSCRPLERMARMDVDWNLKKMEVLMLCLSKISKNILMVTTPNWNCLSMGKGLVKAQNGNVIWRRRAQIKQLAWPMAEREIGHRNPSLVLFARFPVLLLNQLSGTSRTVWGTFYGIDLLLVSPVFMLAAWS